MTAKPYTAPVCEPLDPMIYPPPRGVQLLVVTRGGVLIKAPWAPDMIAWGPLPQIPESVKQRQREIAAQSRSKIDCRTH